MSSDGELDVVGWLTSFRGRTPTIHGLDVLVLERPGPLPWFSSLIFPLAPESGKTN